MKPGSIPGIAKTTAFSMLIEMPELGTLEGKQAASLASLLQTANSVSRVLTSSSVWYPNAQQTRQPFQ
jgi:hypothetical protein